MAVKGKVYIIGAGPGDPKLLTVKAAECIAQADVIVYDRLLGEGITSLARPEAELIYVGKEPDAHLVKQDRINDILVQKALTGQIVARVKGGDPFLFGRGGEEAEFLVEKGIEFEIVPGVTSAIAVPAYGGIPVTHRDFCSSLHIITGHEKADSEDGSKLDYQKLGDIEGTLVFLMGVKNLADITKQLLAGGKNAETPAAIIENGTTIHQRVVTGRLDDIAKIATKAQIKSPAVTVIGEVVNLRDKLNWFPQAKGPLSGKRIVVTRARDQASLLAQKITELGGEAIEIPTIAILPPVNEDLVKLDQELRRLNEYTWLVFTSTNGVQSFWQRMQQLKMDVRGLANLKLAAVGAATAQQLWSYGLKADFIPASFTTASLLEGLLKMTGKADKVLLPRTDIAPEELEQGLKKAGISCTTVTAYRTELDSNSLAKLQAYCERGSMDYITFTSSSTVHNFMKMVSQAVLLKIRPSQIVCIGPVTAETARQAGLDVKAVADNHTIDGIIDTILALEGNKADAV